MLTIIRSGSPAGRAARCVIGVATLLGCADAATRAVVRPPARLRLVSGDAQTAAAGSPVALPPIVRVEDSAGAPVEGVRVLFAASPGRQPAHTDTVLTDRAGEATLARWVLDTVAGPNILIATVAELPPLSFGATGIPGPAARYDVSAFDTLPAAGGSVGILAGLVDAFGNAIKRISVPVTWSTTGGASFGAGTATVTDRNGRSQNTLNLPAAIGATYTVSVIDDAQIRGRSRTITAQARAPQSLDLLIRGSDTVRSAVSFPVQPVVVLADRYGIVARAGVPVSALSLTAGVTLTGAAAVTDASGAARFTGLTATGTAPSVNIEFASPGLVSTYSGPRALLP